MATTKIFFSINELKIITAKYLLDEAGIQSFSLSKKDSSYPGMFGGNIELYVNEENAERARNILINGEIIEE